MKIYKENIIEFLKDKKFMIVLILVAILAYGFTLTNFSVGVDDLSLDRYVSDTYILSQGRWGTFLIYNILGIREFTPFWLDFVTLGVIVLTAIFMCAFLKRISNSKFKNSSYIIFSCGFISCPVISHFFVYQPTKLTVAISNLLVAIVLAIMYENFIDKKNKSLSLISILLLTFSVSMYEACAQTFLVLVFISIFIYLHFNKEAKLKDLASFYIKAIVNLIVSIIFYFFIKCIIIKVLALLNLKKVNYANNQNVVKLVLECKSWIITKKVLLNKYVTLFSNNIFRIFMGISLVGFIISILEYKKEKRYIIYLMIILCNLLLMLFLCGNLYRVCYSWAITTGFVLLYINESVEKKQFNILFTIIIGFVILIQTRMMNQIFYNDNFEYKREVIYATNTIDELLQIDSSLNKPILFVNEKFTFFTYSDIRKNYLEWGLNAFDENCTELVKFFSHLGYDINIVKDYDSAFEIYEKLDEEIKKQNIIELEDFVVVKLDM